jgi:sporulation protein YlmC with PRC-barrel domain
MRSNLSEDDKGKRIVTSTGEEVGRVKDVQAGRAFVDPDPGITDSIRSMLGWGEAQEGDYELNTKRVERITDDEVHLAHGL